MAGILDDSPTGVLDPRAMALMQMGFGLMGASGPSLTPVSLGASLGKAGMLGIDAYQKTHAANQQNQLFNLKMSTFLEEQAEKKRQREAVEQFASTLKPEDVARFRANPKEFLENYGRRHAVGGVLVDNEGRPIYTAPKDPKTQADATGVLRYIDGPNAGQVVPGFATPKAPEGFRYTPEGKLEIIPEWLRGKKDIAAAGRSDVKVENYPNPIPVVGPDGKPAMVQFGKHGEMRPTPYSPFQETKPSTEAERLAGGYAARMAAAERRLGEVGPLGEQTVGTTVVSKIPMVGGYAERVAMSPEQQMYRQAQEDWVRAKLRKESGAVIGKEEMDKEISVYFPMPGDSEQVIKQKADARRNAFSAMTQSAGKEAPKADDTPIRPRSKQFKLDDGKSVIGILEESTGKYYVRRGGKKFYIEE